MSGDNNIPSGWIENILGDLVTKIGSGATPRGGAESYKEQGISLIRSQNILDFKFSYNGLAFIDDEQASKLSNVTVEEHDVLINITGDSVARVCMVPPQVLPARVNQHVSIIRADKSKLDQYFLLYYLLNPTFKNFLLRIAGDGATRNALTKSDIEGLNMLFPEDIKEQQAIASILTTFDDKIELLQAQNQTLEATAQTIFKEWFGKYQVGDELPEGWRVGKLKDLTEKISKGTTPRKIDLEDLEVETPFLKVKDISDEGLISKDGLELIPKKVHEKQLKRSILETNDILFSIAGTIGRVAIVDKELNQANCNQALAFIRLKNKDKYKEYIHLLLKSRDIQNEINSSIVQGVQANVSLAVLGNLPITIPNDSQMIKWKELIYPIYSKLDNNTNQIQTLQQARNTLLPKLMSGKLRVDEFK